MTKAATPDPESILITEWPLNNRGETVRVSIDNFKGTWLISIRKWFKADDGQMRPGKGLAMGAKNLSRLAAAIEQALSTARERDLLPAGDGRDQG
jgi:Transcriptional Coactivator p15 (PC4)